MAVVEGELCGPQVLVLKAATSFLMFSVMEMKICLNATQSFQNAGKKESSHIVGNFKIQTLKILERIII